MVHNENENANEKQPPKKQPKPITDSAPAQLRVAKAAKATKAR